jgi:hypothetical protein
MRHLMTPDPTLDGGHLVDSDLHQMTDDGCPLTTAQSADQDGRDNLGELDTFEGASADFPAALPPVPAGPANSRWERLRAGIELRGRWRAFCERLVRRYGGPRRTGESGDVGSGRDQGGNP